jgi:hypothetical protein
LVTLPRDVASAPLADLESEPALVGAAGTNGARSHTKEGSADAASALGPRNESKLGVRHERHAPSTVGGLVNSNLGELVNSNQEGSY